MLHEPVGAGQFPGFVAAEQVGETVQLAAVVLAVFGRVGRRLLGTVSLGLFAEHNHRDYANAPKQDHGNCNRCGDYNSFPI